MKRYYRRIAPLLSGNNILPSPAHQQQFICFLVIVKTCHNTVGENKEAHTNPLPELSQSLNDNYES